MLSINYIHSVAKDIEKQMELHKQTLNSLQIPVLRENIKFFEMIDRSHLQSMIDQSMASKNLLIDIKNIQETLLPALPHTLPDIFKAAKDMEKTLRWQADIIKPISDSISRFPAIVNPYVFDDIPFRLTFAKRFLASTNFEALKCITALRESDFYKVQNTFRNLTLTYDRLTDSILSLPEQPYLPECVLPGATREIVTNCYALDEICITDESEKELDVSKNQLIAELKEETTGCIVKLIGEVDPTLLRMYIGAQDALESKSVDRTRHLFISLRELFSHLLRRLAPDEEVRIWISRNDKKDTVEDRELPTRRDRILYICQGLDDGPLGDFIDCDAEVFLKLMDIFQRVHKTDLELTDRQLRVLALKADSFLTYILRIYLEVKQLH